jgi:O-antigen/teichoic acid export membrane protein
MGFVVRRSMPGLSSIAQLCAVSLLWLNGVLLSRSLGPSGRGYVQLLLTFALILVVVGGISGEFGLSRLAVASPERRGQQASTGPIVATIMGLITIAVAYPIAVAVDAPSVPVDPRSAFVLALACVPLLIANAWNQRAFYIRGRPLVGGTVALADAFCVAGITLVLLATDNLTPTRAIVSILVGASVNYIISLVVLPVRIGDFAFTEATQIVRLGLTFYPTQLALSIMTRADILILAQVHSRAEVGVYAVAVSAAAPIGVLATTITNALLSRQFGVASERALENTLQIARVLGVIVLVLAVAVALAAEPLVPLIWGSEFSGAIPPLWILLIGVVPMSIQRPLGNYFVREGMAWAIFIRTLAGLMVTCVLCFALVPSLGALGAACGASAGQVIYSALSAAALVRKGRCRWFDLLPGSWDLRLIASHVGLVRGAQNASKQP